MTITFRDALAKALKRTGFSTETLAIGVGLHPADLSLVLNDPSETLDLHDAKRVAAFFGVSLAEFLEAPELKDRVEIADLYNRLPDHLKAQFRAYQPKPTATLNRPDPELP